MRRTHDEDNTLFIVLADHQRVGKGTLYHGLRTPMVLQFPAVVPAGQTLPASALVSSLDIVPTALDAAGLLPAAARGEDATAAAAAMPFNAGARLDGRSMLPLLRGGLGFDKQLGAAPPHWWQVCSRAHSRFCLNVMCADDA